MLPRVEQWGDLDIPALNNQNYPGVGGGMGWLTLQPDDPDHYDWSTVDKILGKAKEKNKFVGLRIPAGLTGEQERGARMGCPDWLKAKVKWWEPVHSLFPGWQPFCWDPNFLSYWTKFIAEFGARYNSDPTLAYIVFNGFQQLNEMRFTGSDEDFNTATAQAKADGYSDLSEAWLYASKQIVDAYFAAFPNKILWLTSALPFKNGQNAQREIEEYIKSKGGMINGVIGNAYLKADPDNPPPHPTRPPTVYQEVCSYRSDPARYYGGTLPSPAPTGDQPLRNLIDAARAKGAIIVELWGEEAQAPEFQGAMRDLNAKLKANLP